MASRTTTKENPPVSALMREIARYLEIVEILRHEGREPAWRAGS